MNLSVYTLHPQKSCTLFLLCCVSLWFGNDQLYPYHSGRLHWHGSCGITLKNMANSINKYQLYTIHIRHYIYICVFNISYYDLPENNYKYQLHVYALLIGMYSCHMLHRFGCDHCDSCCQCSCIILYNNCLLYIIIIVLQDDQDIAATSLERLGVSNHRQVERK